MPTVIRLAIGNRKGYILDVGSPRNNQPKRRVTFEPTQHNRLAKRIYIAEKAPADQNPNVQTRLK